MFLLCVCVYKHIFSVFMIAIFTNCFVIFLFHFTLFEVFSGNKS